MKLQLIETSDYILAVSDEEIKEGDWHYANNNSLEEGLYNFLLEPEDMANCKKIISYKPKGNAPELDLPLLSEMVVENDVEKLALQDFKDNDDGFVSYKDRTEGFISGYETATKVYSEEDLRKAIEMAREIVIKYSADDFTINPIFTYDKIIQSLKQPKTLKWFVAEKEYLSNNGEWKSVLLPSEWEVDTQVRLKTTTIKDKTYLVGTYLYE